MYWCNPKAWAISMLVCGALLIACLPACKPDHNDTGGTIKYFDIKGYFTKDIARLNKLNKTVTKTVTHNGVTETKKVKINSWANELDLFIGSDINKAAWKNSYTVIANDSLLFYKAIDPELKMREMIIRKDHEKVRWILIFNKTKNILYQATEKLTYYPDSLYLIEKQQHVKLMGNNRYKIEGLIGN